MVVIQKWYNGTYYDYITHRDIEVLMHGELATFSTGVGFPQGGVCSAKFWLIAFDTAIKIINTKLIEGNGYADDCRALSGGRRIDHAVSRLQKMLNKLTDWGKTCGLTFSPEKSVAVLFTLTRKVPTRKLQLYGKDIEYSKEVKYLGITLDSKLHWNAHIQDKVTKAKRYINQVAAITRNNWGPKPKLMRWAYLGIVRPMISYGAMIWGHRATALQDKLRRLNRLAMATFCNFPRSTPTAALETMLDVAPLHLHCIREGMAARTRLNDVVELDWEGVHPKNKTHAISHLKYWETALREGKIIPNNHDQHRTIRWNSRFHINLDSFGGQAKHRQLTEINAFTDGSRKNEQTGLGYVIYEKRRQILTGIARLPDYATVFQAEVTAIKRAAMALQGIEPPVRYVKIFVDSQAAIKALANPLITSRSVMEAVDSLNALADRAIRVTIAWIPAHRGLFGNNTADDLAKEGAESDRTEDKLHVPKPLSALKNELENFMYEKWTQEWHNQAGMKHTKAFYYCPNKNKAKYVYKLARLELGRFIRLITGHNNLNYFQSRIGLWHSATCRLCGNSTETFLHFMYDCPRLHQARTDAFLGSLPSADMQWSVRGLLDFSYNPAINLAFEGTWAHGDPADKGVLDSEGELLSESSSDSE